MLHINVGLFFNSFRSSTTIKNTRKFQNHEVNEREQKTELIIIFDVPFPQRMWVIASIIFLCLNLNLLVDFFYNSGDWSINYQLIEVVNFSRQ